MDIELAKSDPEFRIEALRQSFAKLQEDCREYQRQVFSSLLDHISMQLADIREKDYIVSNIQADFNNKVKGSVDKILDWFDIKTAAIWMQYDYRTSSYINPAYKYIILPAALRNAKVREYSLRRSKFRLERHYFIIPPEYMLVGTQEGPSQSEGAFWGSSIGAYIGSARGFPGLLTGSILGGVIGSLIGESLRDYKRKVYSRIYSNSQKIESWLRSAIEDQIPRIREEMVDSIRENFKNLR